MAKVKLTFDLDDPGLQTQKAGWFEYSAMSGHVIKHHPVAACQPPCAIHEPSNHGMISFPLLWREDRTLMERVCPHGIGHPDPDHLLWLTLEGQAVQSVHGCDGCCTGRSVVE